MGHYDDFIEEENARWRQRETDQRVKQAHEFLKSLPAYVPAMPGGRLTRQLLQDRLDELRALVYYHAGLVKHEGEDGN